MKFIIEHLEPRLYKWCLIEYKHISDIIAKKSLIFTNLKNKKYADKLKNSGEVFKKSIFCDACYTLII